jgi:hypothetical protein
MIECEEVMMMRNLTTLHTQQTDNLRVKGETEPTGLDWSCTHVGRLEQDGEIMKRLVLGR